MSLIVTKGYGSGQKIITKGYGQVYEVGETVYPAVLTVLIDVFSTVQEILARGRRLEYFSKMVYQLNTNSGLEYKIEKFSEMIIGIELSGNLRYKLSFKSGLSEHCRTIIQDMEY